MPTTPTLDDLPAAARADLLRAHRMKLNYAVRVLAGPGPQGPLLVVLGEAHLKLGAASELGKQLVAHFALRGVETFPATRVLAGRALRLAIHLPRAALRALSLGLVKDSTIVDAKRHPTGLTVEIERPARVPIALHAASVYLTAFFGVGLTQLVLVPLGVVVPALTTLALAFELHALMVVPAAILRRRPWSWALYPPLAILTARDTIMADGTIAMLAEHPDERTALVIMGRAHLPGFERELVEKHGFTSVPFPPP